MKSMTIEQLEALFQDYDAWRYSTDKTDGNFEAHDVPISSDEFKTTFESWQAGFVTALNSKENISITFSWEANGGQASYEDAHDFTISINSDTFVLSGFDLVDDDGDTISPRGVRHALVNLLEGREWELEVKALLPEPECEIIDKDNDMDTIEIRRDNAPNIKFSGELVASTSSSANNASGSNYSGSAGRWTELYLYKTKGGKYICSSIGRTQWQGERDRFSGEVCDDLAGVVGFFGQGWLAKDLYEEAGIDASISVE